MERRPYPYPQPENDRTFGNQTQPSVQGVIHRTELPKANPWERLHNAPTLSSTRRGYYHEDQKAPLDQLDFAMKGQYDHHSELLKSRAEVLVQAETLGTPHGRILKNRFPEEVIPDPSLRDTVTFEEKSKKSVHSIRGTIEGHHTTATNQGYSRKHDGGFYTC